MSPGWGLGSPQAFPLGTVGTQGSLPFLEEMMGLLGWAGAPILSGGLGVGSVSPQGAAEPGVGITEGSRAA